MALGAESSRVVGLMLRKVAVPAAIGLAAGTALSYWGTRYVATLLYGIDAHDPLTFVAAAAFVAAVSALAAWIPARRAAAIEPARVLRDA